MLMLVDRDKKILQWKFSNRNFSQNSNNNSYYTDIANEVGAKKIANLLKKYGGLTYQELSK